MICQVCGVEAPTKQVEFHQNIGALVMRFSRSVKGQLCRRCIDKNFWSMTGTTLVAGWWGVLSFCVTPVFIVNNVVRFIGSRRLAPVPLGARRPTLTDEVARRIEPHTEDAFRRLDSGESLETVTTAVAAASGATPGEVELFLRAVVKHSAAVAKRK